MLNLEICSHQHSGFLPLRQTHQDKLMVQRKSCLVSIHHTAKPKVMGNVVLHR